ILPPSFAGTVFANKTDFWAPVVMESQLGEVGLRPIVVHCIADSPGRENCGPGRQTGDFRILGRLKPDVSPEAAAAQLTAISAGMTPIRDRGRSLPPPKLSVVAEIEARHENHLPQVRRIAALALCASGLVWLIACGNVANLF